MYSSMALCSPKERENRWYSAGLEVNGKIVGSMRREQDSLTFTEDPLQVRVRDRICLQVNIGGLGLPGACLSLHCEIELTTGRTPLEDLCWVQDMRRLC